VKASKHAVETSRTYWAASGWNPYFMEGLKTIAFELYEQMNVPDAIVVPTGSGGLLTGIYKGFVELKELGVIDKLPKMVGAQASGCDPVYESWKSEKPLKAPNNCKTIASAIKVMAPYNGYTAISAVKHSGGQFVAVNDHQILTAMKELGKEGVFAEPAASAALAGLHKLDYAKDEKIALIITGSGLKDPTALIRKR
jgi:threonine synthase